MKEGVIGTGKIIIERGDLTEMDCDAIVNAANNQLAHGGGVAGAIVSKGGQSIQEESNTRRPVKTGDAVITGGGKLKARHVIHAVGPRMGEGDEDNKLASATRRSLEVLVENDLSSIAFPAISTGIFGYPIERAAPLMLSTAADFLKESGAGLEIRFVLYSKKDYGVFEKAFGEIE